MLPGNVLADLFNFLHTLMITKADIFEAMGRTMFRDFAIILIAWFGVQAALHSGGGSGHGLHSDRLASMLMLIGFGFTMSTFYSRPIPGVGYSFSDLILKEGLYLANIIGGSVSTQIMDRINGLYWSIEAPGLSAAINALEFLRYAIIVLALFAAQATVFVIIAAGYIASAVCILIGPIFIPFFIVPQMEWLFWGWLKALIQFAFYPVVANAYVWVLGNLLLRFTDAHPGPYDGFALAQLFAPLTIILITFAYLIFKVPSLVNSIFGGRSGENVDPGKWL
ncbi:MAG: type IV secretion system protein [Acidobacteriota bacterium]|nr:type IV secretion system protein [Acidobacteriota bacterium]